MFVVFQSGVELLFSPILGVLRGCYICYFPPFWVLSEGGRCIFFCPFGPLRTAVDLLCWPYGPFFAEGGRIIIFRPFCVFSEGSKFFFCNFGCFWRVVHLLYLAILGVIRAHYIYFFLRNSGRFRRLVDFPPFGPFTEGGIFILLCLIWGPFRRPVDSLFSLILRFRRAID